jgi:hypothetical protein
LRTSVGRDPDESRSPRRDSGSAGTWIAECAAFGKGVICLADLDYLIYYSGTYILDDVPQTSQQQRRSCGFGMSIRDWCDDAEDAAWRRLLNRNMKIEPLRAEMWLRQAGHQHDQRRTTGFRRRATDADGWMGLGKQKERQMV